MGQQILLGLNRRNVEGCEPVQVRMEELWKTTRQQEDKRAATPGLLSKLRKNMSSSGR